MSLVQRLPDGPLDIVGDIHGEFDALCALLGHLGYDDQGCPPEGRSLVFVGDFCDRGPNSPAVFELAKRLITSGKAVAVLVPVMLSMCDQVLVPVAVCVPTFTVTAVV